MRYAILGLWRTSIISSTWFWVGQAIVIPTGIFTWTQVRETALKKRLNIPDNVRIEPKDAAHWILFMFLLMVHGGFQIFTRLSLSPRWLQILVGIVLSLTNAFYILVVALYSASDRNLKVADETETKSYDEVDDNDRLLISLQTEVAVFERRVESYTLESTLIGALAFSAFVTVISSDKVSLASVRSLLAQTRVLLHAALTLDFKQLRAYAFDNLTENTVLAAVASLALICSMFFIAVVVARLRFNSLVGFANYSTQMTAAFNEKEEDLARHLLLVQGTPPHSVELRLNRLRELITGSLDEARLAVDQLRPIIFYMGVFRRIGIVVFLATLVASALLISQLLAAGFAVIGLIAYGYPTLDRWARDGALRKHGFFNLTRLLKSKKS
jgi:hypothetical protein